MIEKNHFQSMSISLEDALPVFIGKMYINSLMDLAPITPMGSKVTPVEELNDFADNGRVTV